MIKRIWHGWTTPQLAETYERLLHEVVFPSIEAKRISGYRDIELLRRDHADEVEFVTIMAFDSLQSVIDFQGDDYEACYVPEPARQLLKRWDSHSSHYQVKQNRHYD